MTQDAYERSVTTVDCWIDGWLLTYIGAVWLTRSVTVRAVSVTLRWTLKASAP